MPVGTGSVKVGRDAMPCYGLLLLGVQTFTLTPSPSPSSPAQCNPWVIT